MTFIVVFIAIVFLLLGYYAMDKIDKILVNNAFPSNEDLSFEHTDNNGSMKKVMLIYGDNKLTKRLKDYCDTQQHIYEAITELNHISVGNKYSCLLALSYNDVDNLMIASIGLKVYNLSRIITLCNSQNNLRIYNEFNFDKVLLYNEEMDKLFNNVKEFVQNAVENEV